MQKIVCNFCDRQIKELSVRFSVTYSTDIRIASNGDYSAQMNSLAVEESSLDDETTIEAQCLLCGDVGVITDVYTIAYYCDGCIEQLDQPEGYFCASKYQHFCDECADAKAASMCSWCSFAANCSVFSSYNERKEEAQRLKEEYERAEEEAWAEYEVRLEAELQEQAVDHADMQLGGMDYE